MNSLLKTTRKFGTHLRLQNSYTELLSQAVELNLPYVQFFLTPSTKKNNYLALTASDKKIFLEKRAHLEKLFIHSSYWINPATVKEESSAVAWYLLNKEIALAQELEFSALVLHPGTVTGFTSHQNITLNTINKEVSNKVSDQDQISHNKNNSYNTLYKESDAHITIGINQVTKLLNRIMKKHRGITILLENTAHGNYTIGNDFNHYARIREKSDFPERLGFCLDTAHAHVFGYDLTRVEQFYILLMQAITPQELQLIHLNDTLESCGSKKDSHLLPGTGVLGKELLKKIVSEPIAQQVPLIIEPPQLQYLELTQAVSEISNWL